MRTFPYASIAALRILVVLVALFSPTVGSAAENPSVDDFRSWISEMKTAERGPFARIRWFCADGSVHPPKPYPCAERGGGVQHAQWSERTETLRANGYYIANFLAQLDVAAFLQQASFQDELEQRIVEKYLIKADEGWILRRASFYRGAYQAEDEAAGGRALLMALAGDDDFIDKRYPLLMEAVRMLPHGVDSSPVVEMRRMSSEIAERDASFNPIRIKIHGNPEASDIADVRSYLEDKAELELTERLQKLLSVMEKVYRRPDPTSLIKQTAAHIASDDKVEIAALASLLADDAAPRSSMRAACRIMELLRESLPDIADPARRLDALDLLVALENELYAFGSKAVSAYAEALRHDRFGLLDELAGALYGGGLLGKRELSAVREAILRLRTTADENQALVPLEEYSQAVDYLARLPEWCERSLRLHLGQGVDALMQLDPIAVRYYHDRLRGGPLLAVSTILNGLIADADAMSGSVHSVFGKSVGAGLRGLNPGLAKGILRVHLQGRGHGGVGPEDIYLLPETVDDVPAVAGILSAGRGNVLSHVQLLAGNLGIPNAAVDGLLQQEIERLRGREVVLAVSPRGSVVLEEFGPQWEPYFKKQQETPPETLIRPDMDKIRLDDKRLYKLIELDQSSSGRVCGPKAANLGELKRRWPQAVSAGMIIPFGVYSDMLSRPIVPGGRSMLQWMREQYASIDRKSGEEKARAQREFLATVREWFETVDPGPQFRADLRRAMDETFGADGTYGVFVRSDTNIEDLPGFTGAGLNLTVPNVVGFENILQAIMRVWASPFTERAFGWRQSRMPEQDKVFVSVLLQQSVAAEKSGVLVTADVETGGDDYITAATNFGVGGAVKGQAAEELLIAVSSNGTGGVRLLSPAAEPVMRVILPGGGLAKKRAPTTGFVLAEGEIAQLRQTAEQAPTLFETLRTEDGQAIPADIEFGFQGGRLALFQIRPYLESRRARTSLYLVGLDRRAEERRSLFVNMNAAP